MERQQPDGTGWPRRIAGACAIGAVALIGYVAGVNLPMRHPSEPGVALQDTVALEQQAQDRLDRYARDVGMGLPLADFPLWGEGLSHAVSHRDILPSGGVMVLLAGGCPSCLGEVTEIQEIVDRLGEDCRPVILIADRAGGFDSLVAHLRAAGIRLPVYCDVQETMRRDLRLIPRTVYLSFDAAGVVRDMRAWQAHPGRMEEFFRRHDSLETNQGLVTQRR